MRVLVACEFSGVVRDACIAAGHDAVSIDLLSTEVPGPHIVDNVLTHLEDGWDAMLAFPPCTRLANSGVQWLDKRDLWQQMHLAAAFFNSLLNCTIPRKVLENPIQHRYARALIRKYDQIVHPWWFGHGEQKATCLWLENVDPLEPTAIVFGREQRIWKEGPSDHRWKERSRTLPGFAHALVTQCLAH